MNSPTPCWVTFDTETTGTGFFDRLVELAAVCFADDGTVLDTFQTLINPGRPIPSLCAGCLMRRELLRSLFSLSGMFCLDQRPRQLDIR
jgi:hypothetical protein